LVFGKKRHLLSSVDFLHPTFQAAALRSHSKLYYKCPAHDLFRISGPGRYARGFFVDFSWSLRNPHHPRRANRLSHMTLRVLGDVRQQTDHRSWQPLPARFSWRGERSKV